MYKLYKNGSVKTLIDMSNDLEDINETLNSYISFFPDINYTIYENNDFENKELIIIRTLDDYIKYATNCERAKKILELKKVKLLNGKMN